jgi:hypothetical protein
MYFLISHTICCQSAGNADGMTIRHEETVSMTVLFLNVALPNSFQIPVENQIFYQILGETVSMTVLLLEVAEFHYGPRLQDPRHYDDG